MTVRACSLLLCLAVGVCTQLLDLGERLGAHPLGLGVDAADGGDRICS